MHPPGFAVFTDEIRDRENAVRQPIAGRANAGNVVLLALAPMPKRDLELIPVFIR